MRSAHIRALTGVRFFAALWVVVYHSTRYHLDLLETHHPQLLELVRPLAMQGVRGVDLFFILSGFVLTLNYLDEIGPRLDLAKAGRYLWLRLARVWPLYVTLLVVSGLLIKVRASLWGTAHEGKLTVGSFLEQLFMVQLWTSPHPDGTSWDGPAWSISAEWLAYLLFPVLALVVLRLQQRVRARGLLLATAVVMTPLLVVAITRGTQEPWAWVPRILCEFVAGMLLCAAISRLRVTDRQRTVAGALALAIVVGLVGYFHLTADVRGAGMFATFALVPLVGCLAVGTGPLTALLATPALVLGGQISYGLYLWHSPMLYAFRDLTTHSRLHLEPLDRYHAELVWIVVVVATAWVTHRLVEEPARKLLRDRLDRRFPPVRQPLVGTGSSGDAG